MNKVITMFEKLKHKRQIRKEKRKQQPKFFSEERARETYLGEWQESGGITKDTVKAYYRDAILPYHITNRIRLAKRDKKELGGSVVGHFIGKIVKDTVFVVRKGFGLYSSKGTSMIPEVARGVESDLEKRYDKLEKEGKVKK